MRAWLGLAGAVSLLFGGRAAQAKCDARENASTCVSSDLLWPMPGPQRFAYVAGTELPAPFSLALVSTYQRRPIVTLVPTPSPRARTEVAAVDDQVVGTLVASLTLAERLSAYVAMPSTIWERGAGSSAVTGRDAPATSSIRDPRGGLACAVVARNDPNGFGLAAYGDVQVPIGATTDFSGERGFVLSPTLAADWRAGRLLIGVAGGARVRPSPQSFAGEQQGTQFVAGLGVGVDLLPRELFAIGAESQGVLGGGGRVGGEWLATVRTTLFSALSAMAGGGGALPGSDLIGVGEIRFVLGVAYTPRPLPRSHEPGHESRRIEKEAESREARPRALVCRAECKADSFSPLRPEDEVENAKRLQPLLEELHQCLTRVGAERVMPAILVRYTPDGELRDVRFDADAYNELGCVKDARNRIPALRAGRGTTVRCQLQCR